LPIEHLDGLRFSRKPKYSNQELLMENEDDTSTKFECRLARPTCTMLHAMTEEFGNQKPKVITGSIFLIKKNYMFNV
jgi:hypothetical protein